MNYNNLNCCKKYIISIVHILFHMAAIVFFLCVLQCLETNILSSFIYPFKLTANWLSCCWSLALLVILMIVFGGLVGGFILGLYFWITCKFLKLHANVLFSSIGCTQFKNFIRMHITKDKLTIYPIGIPNPPCRDDWDKVENDNSGSKIIPKNPIKYELIEEPIEINFK